MHQRLTYVHTAKSCAARSVVFQRMDTFSVVTYNLPVLKL